MPPKKARPLPEDQRLPHPARLDPGRSDYDRILKEHDTAMQKGRPRYADPATGIEVFTAQALWDEGFCCDAGCRHCPFLERTRARTP
mgnify:CR=1 FL=1